MDIDFEAALRFVEEGERFLLTTHTNSDADGIGACMALKRLLGQLGKEAHIGLPDPPGHQCEFLEDWEEVRHIEAVDAGALTHAIVADCPALERTGAAQALLRGRPLLNLDHHRGNECFGRVDLVSSSVSSTCEMVFHLAAAAGWPLEAPTAAALYAGILFDTGGFRFSLTTPTTFEVAAALARRGIRIDWLAEQLFGNKSFAAVKQLGRAIDSLELHLGDRVAVLHLDAEAMRAGDPDEVVNYGLLIRGVQVAVLLKEREAGRHRISLRSRDEVDVDRIARTFGGGGHARAAGCNLEGDARQVVEKLLAEIARHL